MPSPRQGIEGPCDEIFVRIRSTRNGTEGTVSIWRNAHFRKGGLTKLSSYSSPSYLSDPVALLAVTKVLVELAGRRVISGEQEVS